MQYFHNFWYFRDRPGVGQIVTFKDFRGGEIFYSLRGNWDPNAIVNAVTVTITAGLLLASLLWLLFVLMWLYDMTFLSVFCCVCTFLFTCLFVVALVSVSKWAVETGLQSWAQEMILTKKTRGHKGFWWDATTTEWGIMNSHRFEYTFATRIKDMAVENTLGKSVFKNAWRIIVRQSDDLSSPENALEQWKS